MSKFLKPGMMRLNRPTKEQWAQVAQGEKIEKFLVGKSYWAPMSGELVYVMGQGYSFSSGEVLIVENIFSGQISVIRTNPEIASNATLWHPRDWRHVEEEVVLGLWQAANSGKEEEIQFAAAAVQVVGAMDNLMWAIKNHPVMGRLARERELLESEVEE